MTLEDIVRTDPIAATPDASIAEVAGLMRDETVGSVVVAEEDRPVGIVTDRDIAVKITAEGKDPAHVTARDVMTPDPVTANRETGVFELTELMVEHSTRRVPVVDDGALYGIVTLDDLLRLFAEEQGNLAAVVEAESPPMP